MASDFTAHHVVKQSSRNFPWGIVVVCLLFISFLLWSKWDKIIQIFWTSTTITASLNDTGFVVGDPITLEGEIRSDGDFMTHTHTLLTQSSGVFGLKSKTVNLSQYSGTISIDGTIALQHSGLVIIEVSSVMDLNLQSTGLVVTGALEMTGQTVVTGETTTSLITGTTTTQTTTTSATVTPGSKKPLTVQEWIEQFAVTIGTGTLFTSSRGHSILFPSKKISFQSLSLTTTDFGIKGLRCYSQINVVAYANKAQVTTAPAVKIFECTNKTDTVPAQFASITLDDGRVFLIEATDPIWGNFANAIEISAIPTTN